MESKSESIYILNQVKTLLLELTAIEYTEPLSVLNMATCGQHIRHILDTYICLLFRENEHVVCYDKRERELQIEVDKCFAINKIETLIEAFGILNKMETPIKIETFFTVNDHEKSTQIFSNMNREMLYAFEHTIHHLAIIKIGLKAHFPFVNIDPNLGIAPSTLKHKKKSATIN